MDPLLVRLRAVRRRLVVVRAVEAGLLGAVAAGVAGLGVMILRILRPDWLPAGLAHPAGPLVLPPAGFVAVFLVRVVMGVALRRAAIAADRAAGLKDRLATALEVLEGTGHGEGAARPARELDARLLDQARDRAAGLDAASLPFARHVGSRGRMTLAVLALLVVGAFLPSRAGPVVAPSRAAPAARHLEEVGRTVKLTPELRERLDRAVARLQEGAARRGEVDRATSAVYRHVAAKSETRRLAEEVLAGPTEARFQAIVRAAAEGDAAGAVDAAADLAEGLSAPAGSGGMGPGERDTLGDDLEQAADRAEDAGLPELAGLLDDAARATQTPTERTDAAFARLAAGMTAALSEASPEGIEQALASVARVRTEVGLPAEPSQPGPEAQAPSRPLPPADGERRAPSVADTTAAEVRPSDRPAVRRYFSR